MLGIDSKWILGGVFAFVVQGAQATSLTLQYRHAFWGPLTHYGLEAETEGRHVFELGLTGNKKSRFRTKVLAWLTPENRERQQMLADAEESVFSSDLQRLAADFTLVVNRADLNYVIRNHGIYFSTNVNAFHGTARAEEEATFIDAAGEEQVISKRSPIPYLTNFERYSIGYSLYAIRKDVIGNAVEIRVGAEVQRYLKPAYVPGTGKYQQTEFRAGAFVFGGLIERDFMGMPAWVYMEYIPGGGGDLFYEHPIPDRTLGSLSYIRTSFSAGLEYELSRSWNAVASYYYERIEFRFKADEGRYQDGVPIATEDIQLVSLGVSYDF